MRGTESDSEERELRALPGWLPKDLSPFLTRFPFQGRIDFFLSPSMPELDLLLLCLLPQLRPERFQKKAASAFHSSLLLSILTREMPSFYFSHKTLSVHIRLQKARVAVKFH